MNEKDAIELMEKTVSRVLPDVLRRSNNSVRIGLIQFVNTNARTVDLLINGTGESMISVKYSVGLSPVVGQQCMLLSPDPKLKSQNLVVGIF